MDEDEIDNYWGLRPDPSDPELAALAEAWIRYQSVDRAHVDDQDPDWWSCEVVMNLDGERPDIEWRVVRALCTAAEPTNEKAVGMIGAGPLEDFVNRNGAVALDLIEPVADSEPVLLDALESVWGWDNPWRPRLDAFLAARGRATG